MAEIYRDVRLPKTVRPTHYCLHFVPDLTRFTFEGSAVIDIVIEKPTSVIVLNALGLTIREAELLYDARSLRPSLIKMDEESERVTFCFDEELPLGVARLSIRFSGVLNDQMAGFCRSVYEAAGEKHIAAIAQFEDASARRAFPCWDEPEIEARFSLSFNLSRSLDAISNMSIAAIMWGGNRKIVHFGVTPMMPTYFLVFAVG